MLKTLCAGCLIVCVGVDAYAFSLFGGKKEKEPSFTEETIEEQTIPDSARPSTFLDTLNRGQEVSLDGAREATPAKRVTSPVRHEEKIAVPNGFRVQCIASRDEQQLHSQQEKLRRRLSDAVYVVHEPPYYKLLVGDFIDRSTAEQMLERLRMIGYPDAWIVSTTVWREE